MQYHVLGKSIIPCQETNWRKKGLNWMNIKSLSVNLFVSVFISDDISVNRRQTRW